MLAGAPLLAKKSFREGIGERMGFIQVERYDPERSRIWLHCASLGEVNVLAAIKEHLDILIPDVHLFMSISTPHGKDRAKEIFGSNSFIFHPPLDIPFAVINALRRVRPHAMIFVETEIWPVWITEAKRMGAKVFLLNGRISPRSIKGYSKVKPLIRYALSNMDAMSMISHEDASRIISLGADPTKVDINGNAKYDNLEKFIDPSIKKHLREMLSITPHVPVLVAGSTRRGEEAILLDAFIMIQRKFPNSILIIAPRHLDRVTEIRRMIKDKGFRGYSLWSRIRNGLEERTNSIILVDTFGDLFNIYSIAWVVFCGASLVPLGGQNPIEPALWGKFILHGPSMEDFQDAKRVLQDAQLSAEVSDANTLAHHVIDIFARPHELENIRRRSAQVLSSHVGAGRRHAMVVAKHMTI
jgi:3-deoxy-D-manno-octulosonic-acid transferase